MPQSKTELCRYYNKGYCSNKPCAFRHDPNIPSTPCKHFLAGSCKHGDKCAYLHEGAEDALKETTEQEEERLDAFTPPEPDPDAEVCRYDPNCYRVNPDHLRRFRHPSRETLPPPRKVLSGTKSAYDWEALAKMLPTDRTPEGAAARKQLFKIMDFNSNGMISLAELDKCVIESLGLGDVFPKKVLLRSFFAANAIAPKKGTLEDDMVTFDEFRFMLCALKRYLECFEIFDIVDSAVERDGRIDTQEVEKCAKVLKDLGLPSEAYDKMHESTLKPPMRTMACAVAAKNHMILFEEFCRKFALKYDLNLQPGDGFGRMFHGARPVKRWGEY